MEYQVSQVQHAHRTTASQSLDNSHHAHAPSIIATTHSLTNSNMLTNINFNIFETSLASSSHTPIPHPPQPNPPASPSFHPSVPALHPDTHPPFPSAPEPPCLVHAGSPIFSPWGGARFTAQHRVHASYPHGRDKAARESVEEHKVARGPLFHGMA
jgi:hypothetical protein